jgi:hypothetical protein
MASFFDKYLPQTGNDHQQSYYNFIAGNKGKEDYMSDMLRAIGIQMSQSRNKLQERNIMEGASESTMRASELATAYQGALAAEQGEISIEDLLKNMRLEAVRAALTRRGQDIQKEIGEQQAQAALWSGLGQGAGTILGSWISS